MKHSNVLCSCDNDNAHACTSRTTYMHIVLQLPLVTRYTVQTRRFRTRITRITCRKQTVIQAASVSRSNREPLLFRRGWNEKCSSSIEFSSRDDRWNLIRYFVANNFSGLRSSFFPLSLSLFIFKLINARVTKQRGRFKKLLQLHRWLRRGVVSDLCYPTFFLFFLWAPFAIFKLLTSLHAYKENEKKRKKWIWSQCAMWLTTLFLS